MNKISVGDTVMLTKNIKRISIRYPYVRHNVFNKNDILTVEKVINRFGKQYLFFKEGNSFEENTYSYSQEVKRFIPLESSKFEVIRKAIVQEEMDV